MGEGVWVFVAPGDIGTPLALPPIRFSDDAGRLTPAHTAASRRARAIESDLRAQLGAPERCPVCDHTIWGLTPSARGLGEHLVCIPCGYTDGTVTGVYGWLEEPAGDARKKA
ncbi:MAG: hypothetical protein QOI71_1109 [Gaiellales bacterium]|nr:hypothetical protein [Gaiellales bacterium]